MFFSKSVASFPEKFPIPMVIYTDHSTGPGIHWVLLMLLAGCLYFDHFGVSIVETEISISNLLAIPPKLRESQISVAGA